jgi:hypothetical protein
MLSTSLWPPAMARSCTPGQAVLKPSAPLAPARGAIGPARRENSPAARTTQSPVARSLRSAWIQRLRISVAPQGKSRRTMLPVSTTRSKRRLPFSASSTSSASQVPKLWAITLTRLAPVRSIRSRSSPRSHCTRLARAHGTRKDSRPKKP